MKQSTIIFVLFFIMRWYSDSLYDRLLVFAIIPYLILIVASIACAVSLFKGIARSRRDSILGLLILGIMVITTIFLPFRDLRVVCEYWALSAKRLEVIDTFITGETALKSGEMRLPLKYQVLSSDGTVYVYQNDQSGVEICFWVFRGILSDSFQMIYSDGGKELIEANEGGNAIVEIRQMSPKWYYVHTN